jgi:hypothetical protein
MLPVSCAADGGAAVSFDRSPPYLLPKIHTYGLRAAWAAIVFALVGVMPSWANVEILNLRLPLFVKETKIAVMGRVDATVYKAPSQKREGVALCHRLTHKVVLGFNIEAVAASESPIDWIDDTSALPFFYPLTSIEEIRKSFFYSAVSLLLHRRGEQISEITECEGRFSAGILILNRNLDWLPDSRFYSKYSILRSYPCTLRTDNRLGRCLSLFGHRLGLSFSGLSLTTSGFGRFLGGVSLQFCSVGLQFDGTVDLNHFVHLPAYCAERESDQNDCHPLSKFLSAIIHPQRVNSVIVFFGRAYSAGLTSARRRGQPMAFLKGQRKKGRLGRPHWRVRCRAAAVCLEQCVLAFDHRESGLTSIYPPL